MCTELRLKAHSAAVAAIGDYRAAIRTNSNGLRPEPPPQNLAGPARSLPGEERVAGYRFAGYLMLGFSDK